MQEKINKAVQTLPVFNKIIEPLKINLNLSFGYMKVFKGAHYYILVEETSLLREFVTAVDKSSIFCGKDITGVLDNSYRFTLWPTRPLDKAMEIYFKYNCWNGITISKISDSFIEQWWFTSNRENTAIQEWFIANKGVLLKFIHYFNSNLSQLSIPSNRADLFKFTKGFDMNVQSFNKVQELQSMKSFLESLKTITISTKCDISLSPRELKILSLLAHGLTAKLAAKNLNISYRTIQHHIEHIKSKTDLHYKSDIIHFYLDILQE